MKKIKKILSNKNLIKIIVIKILKLKIKWNQNDNLLNISLNFIVYKIYFLFFVVLLQNFMFIKKNKNQLYL